MDSQWAKTDRQEPVVAPGEPLARFVCQLDFDELDHEVVHQAKRVLLEALSWPLLGLRRPEAAGICRFVEQSMSPANSTVVGHSSLSSAALAAYANGSMSQIQDCNDGFRVASVYGGSYHPGRVVVPVALASCEAVAGSGEDLLTLLVAGYEVAGTIRGLEPRPPAAAYAAAAVAGRALGLDTQSLLNAMGIAGHHASPVPADDPYDVSFLTVGNLARAGVDAAVMAREGMTGPPIRDDSRLSRRLVGDGLGDQLKIMTVYMKPHLGCRLNHGAVEAALDFRRAPEFDWRQLRHVRVRVIPEAHYVGGHVTPTSYYRTCQISLPYSMACAFIDGEVGEPQFTTSRIADEDVQELHSRIYVETDEALNARYPPGGRPTIVEVELEDGGVLRWSGEFDKGEPENPLSDEELIDKFHRWAGPSLESSDADELVSLVFALEEEPDLDRLSKLLRSSGIRAPATTSAEVTESGRR